MAVGQFSLRSAFDKPTMSDVGIDNSRFASTELTTSAGTQATRINQGETPHVASSLNHRSKSQALDTDEKFSFTFDDPGSYEYFCGVHPKLARLS
jgi:plastocyanin